MRKTTKFAALLLAVMMIVSCIPMMASAEDATNTIVVDTVDAEPSATNVEVPVTITGAACAVQFKIAYDDALTLTAVDDSDFDGIITTTLGTDAEDFGLIVEAAGAEDFDEATFNLVFTAPAAEGTYDITVSDVDAADVNEDDVDFDITDGAVVVAAAVVEPVLDSNIGITANIAVKSTITITYRLTGLTSYDNFYLEISANRISSADGFNYVEKADRLYKSQMTAAGSLYAVQYTGIAMYELNVPLNATVYVVDGDGNEIFYSTVFTTSVKQLATSSIASSSNAKLKTMFADLLNLGAEAQTYFAAAGSDLASIALPNVGLDQSLATAEIGTLATATANANVTTAANYAVNPGIRYGFKNAAGLTKVVFSYYDVVNEKTVTTEAVADDMTLAGGAYYYRYQDIAFYAGAATVTATVYNGDNVIYSSTYCLEAVLNANLNSASVGALSVATAKFGKAAQAYYL